ncbi:MAG: hypothetical protein V8T90_12815 [Victivallales bacterium]
MKNGKNSISEGEINPASLMASMDLEFIAAGIGEKTLHWTKLNAFCGYVFFRIYCLESGRFQIKDPYGVTVLEPGNLYLIPCFTPLTNSGIEPSTHYWIHFVFESAVAVSCFCPSGCSEWRSGGVETAY